MRLGWVRIGVDGLGDGNDLMVDWQYGRVVCFMICVDFPYE